MIFRHEEYETILDALLAKSRSIRYDVAHGLFEAIPAAEAREAEGEELLMSSNGLKSIVMLVDEQDDKVSALITKITDALYGDD